MIDMNERVQEILKETFKEVTRDSRYSPGITEQREIRLLLAMILVELEKDE